MKRLFLITLTVAGAALMLAAPATAQVTASADLVVTANNQGIFTFAITEGNFDFGNVDNDSTTGSSAGVPVSASGQSALYPPLGRTRGPAGAHLRAPWPSSTTPRARPRRCPSM